MDVSLAHVQTMARYNRWMNQKVYDGCAGLSEEDRKRDMGAFFRSIHGTLNHILLADRIWICLLYTSPSPRDRQKSRMPSSA